MEAKAGGDDPASETGIASNTAALPVTWADVLEHVEAGTPNNAPYFNQY